MKKQYGFTLIELLLVLAIIGIIAAIAVPAILGQRDKAKAKAVQSMVANISGECARVSDSMKEAGTMTNDKAGAEAVIDAVLALTNYTYPNVKNPYGGTDSPFVAKNAPTKDGEIGLQGDMVADAASGSATYPAVIITGKFKNGSTKKLVALD